MAMDQLSRLVAIQEISDLIGRYCMPRDVGSPPTPAFAVTSVK